MREDQYLAKLESARQGNSQTPQQFNQYLNSLESKISDKLQESLTPSGKRYFYKLIEPLRQAIRANNQQNLDFRRPTIIMTAALTWATIDPIACSRKRTAPDSPTQQPDRALKKPKGHRNANGKLLFNPPSATLEPTTVCSCSHCKKLGYTEDTCYQKHPHLKPQWLRRQNNDVKKDTGKA